MSLPLILWSGRRWVVLSVLLFLVGIGYGAARPEQVFEGLRPVVEQLADVGASVSRADGPLERTWIYYRNNARAVTVMMLCALVPFLGGVVPVSVSLLNGAILGAVFALAPRLAGRSLDTGQLALALLPHGVFELPALWLAAAWSLKLALGWTTAGAAGRRWETWTQTGKEAIVILALAMPLLVLAAFIEGNLSPLVLRTALAAILLGSF